MNKYIFSLILIKYYIRLIIVFNYEIGLWIVIEDGLDIDRIRKLIWFFHVGRDLKG
jgi:hypothetical protein